MDFRPGSHLYLTHIIYTEPRNWIQYSLLFVVHLSLILCILTIYILNSPLFLPQLLCSTTHIFYIQF
ncbi:hypothetical protein L873DRAFT_871011 [Choiromyces venosus 120613-1]|uniref:Uncharacterized protein n=1 Tax=Choiromyces venosus 120613-1 TaxID=1336337 RepID=A0A3N4IWV9_9PEZI|nr:hypothetical protein L873DRAFT_871011 [Choiromyces venosus 120613-1]